MAYRNKNDRKLQKSLKETFRTPLECWTTLFDKFPWLIKGPVLDPSAGDGRMTKEILKRRPSKKHTVIDIRRAEQKTWKRQGLVKSLGTSNCLTGDFLQMKRIRRYSSVITNPPFSLSQDFTVKALKTWVKDKGYVVMLQRLNWLGTAKRSQWLADNSGLKYVIVITKRIVFEIDGREKNVADTHEYAFFVFQRGFVGDSRNRWLFFDK